MKPVSKEEWVAALRSDEYKQTQMALVNSAGRHAYCCLGVFCSLAGISDSELFKSLGTRQTVISVPGPVAQKLKKRPNYITQLVNLNDSRKWNFHQIADWIETNL